MLFTRRILENYLPSVFNVLSFFLPSSLFLCMIMATTLWCCVWRKRINDAMEILFRTPFGEKEEYNIPDCQCWCRHLSYWKPWIRVRNSPVFLLRSSFVWFEVIHSQKDKMFCSLLEIGNVLGYIYMLYSLI